MLLLCVGIRLVSRRTKEGSSPPPKKKTSPLVYVQNSMCHLQYTNYPKVNLRVTSLRIRTPSSWWGECTLHLIGLHKLQLNPFITEGVTLANPNSQAQHLIHLDREESGSSKGKSSTLSLVSIGMPFILTVHGICAAESTECHSTLICCFGSSMAFVCRTLVRGCLSPGRSSRNRRVLSHQFSLVAGS